MKAAYAPPKAMCRRGEAYRKEERRERFASPVRQTLEMEDVCCQKSTVKQLVKDAAQFYVAAF